MHRRDFLKTGALAGGLAYAFEQGTRHRRAPSFRASADLPQA